MPVWISAYALTVTLPFPVLFSAYSAFAGGPHTVSRSQTVLFTCRQARIRELLECTLPGWGLFWCWCRCHWPAMICAVGHLPVPGLQRSGLMHT